MIMLSIVVRKACPIRGATALHPHTCLCPESHGTAPAGSRTPWPGAPLRVLVPTTCTRPLGSPQGPRTSSEHHHVHFTNVMGGKLYLKICLHFLFFLYLVETERFSPAY